MVNTLEEQMAIALAGEHYEDFERLARQAQAELEAGLRRLAYTAALHRAALWYADQNIPVFPLQPRDKKPFPKSRGFKDATTNHETITAWWERTPTANIGIPTGILFDVIDIDGEQGAISYRTMLRENVVPHLYGAASTGRDCGRHLYIQPTGDGNTAHMLAGIDYRGRGGYVVAPPSVTTRRYDWHIPLDVAGLKAAAA